MSLPCGFWLQARDTLGWGQREHERGKGHRGVQKRQEGDILQWWGCKMKGPLVSMCVSVLRVCVLRLSTYVSLGADVCVALFCVCGLCLMSDSTRVSADASLVCFDVSASLCLSWVFLKKILFLKFWLQCTARRILVLWPGD